MAGSGQGDPFVTAALAQMAMLRQAEVGDITLDLYSAQLAEQAIEPQDVVTACRQIEQAERAEGETAFPSLGTLLKLCRSARYWRQKAAQLALAASQPMPPARPPLTEGEVKIWLARLKDAAQGRRVT